MKDDTSFALSLKPLRLVFETDSFEMKSVAISPTSEEYFVHLGGELRSCAKLVDKLHTIFLGLGANVGDKKGNIKKAIELLKEKVKDIVVAPIYETKPWGYEKQDNFLNTAFKGSTSLSPIALFKFIKDIEKKVGRIERFKWGPREIDIDILFYDDLIYKDNTLEIPHPRLEERDFVLKPLIDLDPDFVHPVLKKTVSNLYGTLSKEESSIVRTITL